MGTIYLRMIIILKNFFHLVTTILRIIQNKQLQLENLTLKFYEFLRLSLRI